jgi:hypothetical protein
VPVTDSYAARLNKIEFKQLSGKLRAHVGRELEKILLTVLRIQWPALVQPTPMSLLDRAGIDCVLEDDGELRVAIQCKGSAKPCVDREVVRSIRDSVTAFRNSGMQAKLYVLFVNQPVKSGELRADIQEMLRGLEAAGVATRAEYWDVEQLLRKTWFHLLELLIDQVGRQSAAAADDQGRIAPRLADDVLRVPYGVSIWQVDTHRLRKVGPVEAVVGDPSQVLFETPRSNLTLLLGEYGFGKTTSLLRGLSNRKRTAVYIPAARIPSVSLGTKVLLMTAINLDAFGAEFDLETRQLARSLASGAFEYLLKKDREPWLLILDALDESPILNRPGRLRALLNALREIRVPVILSARSEWWATQETELRQSAAGPMRRNPEVARWQTIRLEPWGVEQMLELTDNVLKGSNTTEARGRLKEFRNLVVADRYEEVYRDIPRRPLFLRWILETLREEDLGRIGKRELLERWLMLKLQRDYDDPILIAGKSRAGIAAGEESFRDRVALAMRAMETAASLMFDATRPVVVLTPFCELTRLEEALPELRTTQRLGGLVTNSLLRIEDMGVFTNPKVLFSHRVYQEYFLARWATGAGKDSGLAFSEPILEWVRSMSSGAR